MAKGSEVKYRSACGRYEVVFDGSDQQTLFGAIASFQEIFEDDTNVSIEGVQVDPRDIKFRVRTVADKDGKKNDFYEKVYVGSNPKLFGYKMEYGSSQEDRGSLFPRRKDKDGQYYKNNGWHKWEGAKEGDSAPTAKDQPKAGTKEKAPF